MFSVFNPLNAELNPICHLLALLGTHHTFHISRIRVNTVDARQNECSSAGQGGKFYYNVNQYWIVQTNFLFSPILNFIKIWLWVSSC